MAKNPYTVLGVPTSATDSDIRSAFRKLAKQYHPDRNPDNKQAEEKFKEVSAAFDILGDAERRKKFDRGEIDADGRARSAGPGYRPWYGERGSNDFGPGAGSGTSSGTSSGTGADFSDISDIFADLFGAKPRGGRGSHSPGGGSAENIFNSAGFGGAGHHTSAGSAPVRGLDLRYRLEVDFLEAAKGTKKRVTMPDGRALSLTIPAGLDDGQTLRLRGQGETAPAGGKAGDVYVEVSVRPHRIFERDGFDIHLEAPISLKEAVLGGKITVPTIDGEVAVTVPRGANSGSVLRLKGRGVRSGSANGSGSQASNSQASKSQVSGDQYVKLRIVLPEGGDPELEAFVKNWDGGNAEAPRKHFEDV